MQPKSHEDEAQETQPEPQPEPAQEPEATVAEETPQTPDVRARGGFLG